MSAATIRNWKHIEARARRIADLRHQIRHHAECENSHLISARDATDAFDRAHHEEQARWHRAQGNALAVELGEP